MSCQWQIKLNSLVCVFWSFSYPQRACLIQQNSFTAASSEFDRLRSSTQYNWVCLLSTGTTFGNGSGRVEEAEEWKDRPDITETSLDVMHFCLIDCLDAAYCFLSPFCFGGGADASHSPFLTTTSRLAFSFTQQEPSGGSFDCKNSHWRSWVGGAHRSSFMYWHHNVPFQIADEEAVRGGGGQCAEATRRKWMCCMYLVLCVCTGVSMVVL